MAKKFFTRSDIQKILSENPLSASVTYLDRPNGSSPDNFIVYMRLNSRGTLFADDVVHISKAYIGVIHFHKKKLDSIEGFMKENFRIEPYQFNVQQLDTDYLGTYYRFECLTGGQW